MAVRSLRGRVAAVVAVGALLAILLPAAVTVFAVWPSAYQDPSFVRALLTAALLLAAVSWLLGRIAADFAVRPLDNATTRLEAIAAGHFDETSLRPTVQEIERLEEAVQLIVRRAWERERRHTTTVGALAHDVRASLAAMVTILDHRLSQHQPNEATLAFEAEVVRALLSEVKRMQWIAGDLVVLMRSSVGSGFHETVDVGALAETVADAVRNKSGMKIEVEVTKPCFRRVTPGVVERLLRNLIENAASAARSTVKIEVLEGLVIVADDGQGFPAAMLKEVTSTVEDQRVDHGVGFNIASRLAELCGGHVVIGRSTQDGSTVLVYL